ncbi:chemotaxis protein CheW [Mangrovitalea sediminis]|uniref:chemotaxis protein CheW n=1 Tax=Mangrovitalea sediminis TaxID=1982043 RepID=UPI000BE4D1BB|nr:chemotaxis protein CheW [Mangrovitalea sediminis]
MNEDQLTAAVSSENGQEFLTFTLGTEHYALDILKVKEIRGYDAVTKIANAPAFIKGVINLRGDIVPIIDLRMKFDIGDVTYNEFTIVIVLQINSRYVGVVVDAVSDVITLGKEDVRPAPEFGVSFDSRYLLGLASVGESMVVVIDIERLISSDEIGLMDQVSESSLTEPH